MSRLVNSTLPIYIVSFVNIKVIVLSLLVTNYLIKNGLVISYIIGKIILIDKEKSRSDIEREKSRPLDAKKIRLDIEGEETRLVNI